MHFFLIAKTTSDLLAEAVLAGVGFFFLTVVVLLASLPKDKDLYLLIPLMFVIALISVLPYFVCVKRGLYRNRASASTRIDAVLKFCWTTIGGALFVAIGRNSDVDKLASSGLTGYVLVSFFCLQQASFWPGTYGWVKFNVWCCLYFQMPVFATTLLWEKWSDFCHPLILLTPPAVCGLVTFLKNLWSWTKMWGSSNSPTRLPV